MNKVPEVGVRPPRLDRAPAKPANDQKPAKPKRGGRKPVPPATTLRNLTVRSCGDGASSAGVSRVTLSLL